MTGCQPPSGAAHFDRSSGANRVRKPAPGGGVSPVARHGWFLPSNPAGHFGRKLSRFFLGVLKKWWVSSSNHLFLYVFCDGLRERYKPNLVKVPTSGLPWHFPEVGPSICENWIRTVRFFGCYVFQVCGVDVLLFVTYILTYVVSLCHGIFWVGNLYVLTSMTQWRMCFIINRSFESLSLREKWTIFFDALGIQSHSDNGSGTKILYWGGDWGVQSPFDKVIGSLGMVSTDV